MPRRYRSVARDRDADMSAADWRQVGDLPVPGAIVASSRQWVRFAPIRKVKPFAPSNGGIRKSNT